MYLLKKKKQTKKQRDCFGYEKKHGIAKYILEKQTTTIRSCELVKINDCFKQNVSWSVSHKLFGGWKQLC